MLLTEKSTQIIERMKNKKLRQLAEQGSNPEKVINQQTYLMRQEMETRRERAVNNLKNFGPLKWYDPRRILRYFR